VLLVVVHHYFPSALPGGFMGVDVFFVISGYLITRWLLVRADSNLLKLLINFFYGRFLRLAPALLFMTTGTYLIASFVLLPVELRYLGKHGVAGLLGAANITLWTESGYFDADSSEKPFLHLWSLGVEEQFYLFWPITIVGLILFLGSRRKPLFPFLLATSLAMWLTSFLISLWLTSTEPSSAYFLFHSRAWELISGALLAIIVFFRPKESQFSRRIAAFLKWTGFVGIALLAFIIDRTVPFPGVVALLPVFAASLVVFTSVSHPRSEPQRYSRPMLFLGDISYALYLWHWPLLVIAGLVYPFNLGFWPSIVLIILSVLFASLSTLTVERVWRINARKIH